MPSVIIFSDQEFEAVSNRINHLAKAKAGSKEEQELKKLTQAVAQYEKRKLVMGLFSNNNIVRVH